ncbi:heat shock factor protein isoform X2 [Cimex lectularius]|uniref:HSF-type DNA-binding domain-containing protein n=1 Tax=Cimex lectularius TaxID=79782 RepID=A0A8I6RF47_CIMLE|nr:heat shock factor protein isoform X2 [Cimex lectularius]
MNSHTDVLDTSIPAFIAKLWHMVSDSSTDDLICWGQEDTSFVIKNEQRFCSELLPRYYKHNNMSSFIRQLNKYDFHKVISADSLSLKSAVDKQDLEFIHPHFVKNYPGLLSQIKRKLSNSKEVSEFKGDHNILTKLVKEVQQLQTKQELVESKLIAMKNENDALWREHAVMKKKHHTQQKIVNKLVQFLVSLVRGINIRGGIPLMLKDNIIQPVDGLKAIKARGFGDNAKPTICEVDHLGPMKDSTNINIAELLALPSRFSNNIDKLQKTAKNDGFQPSIYSTLERPKLSIQAVKPGAKRKTPVATVVKPKKAKTTGPCFTDEQVQLDINDITGFDLDSSPTFPVVTSPGGMIINSPNSNDGLLEDKGNSAQLNEPQSDVQLSPLSTICARLDTEVEQQDPQKLDNASDMGSHLEGIQSDLDALKDILKSENLSFDANTIMGLFNVEDGMSLDNTMDGGEGWSGKLSLGSDDNGTEIVPYTPILFDMVNELNPGDENGPDDPVVPELDANLPDLNTPLPEISELNTPLPIAEELLGLNEPDDL